MNKWTGWDKKDEHRYEDEDDRNEYGEHDEYTWSDTRLK